MITGQDNPGMTIPAMPATSPDFVRYLNVRSAYGASFAPDGRHITFLTDITGVAEVWRVPVPPVAPAGSGAEVAWPEQLTFGGARRRMPEADCPTVLSQHHSSYAIQPSTSARFRPISFCRVASNRAIFRRSSMSTAARRVRRDQPSTL